MGSRRQRPSDVHGPFGKVVDLADNGLTYNGSPLRDDTNSLVVTRRLAFDTEEGKDGSRTGQTPPESRVRKWASVSALGARGRMTSDKSLLLSRLHERRAAFLDTWKRPPATAPNGASPAPRTFARYRLVAEWRIAIGLGLEYGPWETGLALHGTYGFPILPGSALKGVAAAAAREAAEPAEGSPADTTQATVGREEPSAPELIRTVFGTPRPDDQHVGAQQGSVRFLDALPDPGNVYVHEDVITPHQKSYYQRTPGAHPDGLGIADGSGVALVPPAEHHQPEPAPFLSVSGSFRIDLLGRSEEHTRYAIDCLQYAGEHLGLGGRTTAGYGYFCICEEQRDG
ncbi:CRISPR type III-B/RAMP module RAMP protein Cmr6 [Haloactinospora alba]|uniref:CRISPR type III-B/RAMP module RAMP protein Cmr6 n=1 Tax=Haloactinospora alba TaxID=405555 RepID=A0A543N9V4_9ACTN|nr:type III-B CRISPR module RAMP protein Cmr6 [Haloactinospora alba]TQN28624.1 CRISPR type III-B/RAMP module RAMP protein Cmr6 [Haloactinospora alba]